MIICLWAFSDSVTRPVLIVGPLSDAVTEKLLSDSGQTFARCETEYMNCSQEALEKGMSDNVLIDFRRRGSHFECTTVAAIRDVIDRVSWLPYLQVQYKYILRVHLDLSRVTLSQIK